MVPDNPDKSWNWEKQNSRPLKVLEFQLQSLEILEWTKFLPLTAKIITIGHNTFGVTMYENGNGDLIFPQN